ncbi:DoxX family protein [Castellaniella caeni]|uniref:DoxX family protein n=1 Tax=Castellaniella caeni TaxID=266123 RepID=UPI00082BB602|nr:DoxX family protein [Castellaniella caeni]
MSNTTTEDLGKLVLRVGLGVIILLHGIAKLNGGIDWMFGLLTAKGLPHFVAYGVYIGEVVAPVLLILGLWARVGALILVVNMLFVFGLVHMADFFVIGKSGGWALELQGIFLLAAAAIALLGAGAYSLGGRNGRWN